MATQVDLQASPTMQENTTMLKKRKRASNSDDLTPSKRGNLQEVNGNGLPSAEASLPDATSFPDPSNASNFPPHPNTQHDEDSRNMLAALQAHANAQNYNTSAMDQGGFEMGSPTQNAPQPYMQSYAQHPDTPTQQHGIGSDGGAAGLRKPEVGTEEWNKIRRDNHKEVERRRRETINEGINELAKIVPGNEKNKGSILSRTVLELKDLRARVEEYERQGGLSHNVLEQAVRELSSANDVLKHGRSTFEAEKEQLQAEKEQLRAENARLVQKVLALGGTVDDEDDHTKIEN